LKPLATHALDLGSPAPPLALPSAAGGERSLSDFHGRPVMVSFLGPAHCSLCRAHVIRLIQARHEFEQQRAEVVLVVYHDPSLVMRQMLHDLQLPFTLLVDESRASYARWGLALAGWRAIVRPGLYWALFRQKLRGEAIIGTSPGTDRQLGGDFVIDRGGRVTFANRLNSFHDRTPVKRLLEEIRRA
jgi:peroxiredoxin